MNIFHALPCLHMQVKGMEVFLSVTDHDSHIDELSSKPHIKKGESELVQQGNINLAVAQEAWVHP